MSARFRLQRGPDYVRLLVDGRPVTNWCSLGQARAAACRLGGWRGSQLWTDADGSEWVCERHGGPATTAEARAGSEAIRRETDGEPHFVPTNWRTR